MNHLKNLKTPVNKFANTIRLIGYVLALVFGVLAISFPSNEVFFWSSQSVLIVVMIVLGIAMIVIGDGLWKALLANSDVTVRRFYFYDEE